MFKELSVMIALLVLITGCGRQEKGVLHIQVYGADALLYIDNDRVGNAPSHYNDIFTIKVNPGEHIVRAVKGDKEGVKTVFVAADSIQKIVIFLDGFSLEGRKKAMIAARLLKSQLVPIKAGSFMMGSPLSEKDRYKDESRHQVTLTKSFKKAGFFIRLFYPRLTILCKCYIVSL